MTERLSISLWRWQSLIRDLRRRGARQHESGAFLLAAPGSSRVTAHVCYDDLDSQALESGIIVFRGAGYTRLWQLCEARQLRVAADVHTHPGDWTEQSHTDLTPPMVGTPGHVALIVPNFAQGNTFSLRGIGIYRYRGNHRWQTCDVKSALNLCLL